MAQVPKPFMRGDKAFHVAAARSIRRERPPGQHHLKDMEELFGHFKICLVAGVVKRDQNFVRESPAISGCPRRPGFTTRIFFSLAHRRPYHLIPTRMVPVSAPMAPAN
jgi:hypothetical protein